MIPEVQGPIAEDDTTHMFSSMKRAMVPFDVADYGYVEEEYFISGTSNVYDEIDGSLAVVTKDVPYVNRIIVRRPAKAADSSGVIDVELTNASNGYAGEDMWRRLWQHHMANGDTYIGVVSKPNQIVGLKTYDPVRYAPVAWDEEGQAWDIIAQMGALLKSEDAGLVLGGQQPRTILLTGQSQSGGYIATYTNKIAGLAEEANGQSVYDGYLNVAGLTGRSLRTGGQATPAADPVLSVPNILVDSELILDRRGPRNLPPKQRVWAVPGTPHTDLLSPVIPSDEEILKSGRTPDANVHKPEFLAKISYYPLEPTIFAATDALVKWHQEGIPAAPSLWETTTATGALLRDDAGNALGGVRYGLIDHPLGQYLGIEGTGFTAHGIMHLMSLDEFLTAYKTRAQYLALMAEVDARQIRAGYLTPEGEDYFIDVANYMMDRIGVAKTPTPTTPPVTTPPVTTPPVTTPPVTTPPVTTPPPTPSYPGSIYTTPGYHDYNGRHWFTSCEPYSVTQRCRTLIQATTVTQVNGQFVSKKGWAFNNLTYLPSKKSAWAGNPLGRPGSWTAADGRQWRTECNTPATGGNGCRSYATAKVIGNVATPGQPVRLGWITKEIFNNIVLFS
ncbi:alpha/beta hydrolase domain-containing protein [Tessaracoccus antarcticus]|uniref:alpha/beta hydrolase domain-containing protein n=1 Tax=Tessaracoccus antarcticus TaxID=2479848 RepID=UPI001313DEE9|nr:alpha/beta hydrolase domain-containing protein [Tessaracoccus antarcticus]